MPTLGWYPTGRGLREMRSPRFWRDVLLEFLLSALIIFLATAVGVQFSPPAPGQGPPLLRIGLLAGFSVFTFIDAFGHLNMAAFNPIITFMFVLTGRMSIFKALMYLGAQVMGSVCGSGFVYLVTPVSVRPTIMPLRVNPDIHPLQGMAVEWMITTSVIFVAMGVFDGERRQVIIPAFPIGFTVFCGIQAAAYYTGGCMNPIVAFGPAVISGIWDNHWVYWVGPYLGSTTAVLLFAFFTWDGGPFSKDEEASDIKDSSVDTDSTQKTRADLTDDVFIGTKEGITAPWDATVEEQTTTVIQGVNGHTSGRDMSEL